MKTKSLAVIAAAILGACGNRTITMTVGMGKLRDANIAKLTTELKSINYPASVTHEGDTVNIRVGAASLPDVRRAMCRQMGWPSAEWKMVRLAETLRFLRMAGITKVKIIGEAQTLDVELEQDGRCRKTS